MSRRRGRGNWQAALLSYANSSPMASMLGRRCSSMSAKPWPMKLPRSLIDRTINRFVSISQLFGFAVGAAAASLSATAYRSLIKIKAPSANAAPDYKRGGEGCRTFWHLFEAVGRFWEVGHDSIETYSDADRGHRRSDREAPRQSRLRRTTNPTAPQARHIREGRAKGDNPSIVAKGALGEALGGTLRLTVPSSRRFRSRESYCPHRCLARRHPSLLA